MMQNCKHGINPRWCALCAPPSKPVTVKRQPKKRLKSTVHGTGAIDRKKLLSSGYVVVVTCKGRDHESFELLSENTTLVHFHGTPFLWAIKKVLKLAPNLKTFQVIPTMEKKIGQNHRKLCDDHGVKIQTGHSKPEAVWKDCENRSPFYQTQRSFFLDLEGEQKRMFEELILLGFDAARITARYFCLKGEDFLPQHKIAKEFGFIEHERYASSRVNAVIHYLDPSFDCGRVSKRFARSFKARVTRIRELLAATREEELHQKFLDDRIAQLGAAIGITKLPRNFPLARLDILEAIIEASRKGELDELKKCFPRLHQILVLRFGIEDGEYRTLQSVGDIMGVSHEWVRQLEEQALVVLDISGKD